MGCTQSKVENEDAVKRCKQRKQDMKDAVAGRNLFAAAHSAYTMALKNTGAALSDYSQGEVQDNRAHSSSASVASAAVAAAAVHPPIESLRPPPPLPDFSPIPLMRATSMPAISLAKSAAKPSETIEEEEDADEDDDDRMAGGTPNSPPHPLSRPPAERPTPPPPPPEADNRGESWDFFLSHVHETMSSQPMPEHEEEAPPPPTPPVKDDEMSSSSNKNIATEMTTEKGIAKPPVKISKKQKPGSSGGGGGGSSSSQHLGVGPEGSKRGKGAAAAANVSLVEILSKLDDKFLKASVSAQEVSKMLEANRLHYHSNFADNRGHIDHSARVMRVITWNRSFKGIPNTDDGKDDFDAEELETHATVLDKLLAWEKKLYDEVKAGELMKLEYQRKIALLNKQKKRNISSEALEKTKAAVSHLHTRYIVDMQSMDSTVSEIHRLRDEQLYPKLVDLVGGMTIMWETMHESHREQLEIVDDLRFLDTFNAPKETSVQHHDRTRQLCRIAGEWNSQFMKLMAHQKEYIHALNSWVKLTLIPIESSLKEKVSSPPRVQHPPIQALLLAWQEELEKLPVELAKSAISSFAAGVEAILVTQEEELKQKEKIEEVTKEYNRKTRAFDDWYQKYLQRRMPSASEEADPDRSAESGTQTKDPVAERLLVVELLKKKMEDEIEAHQKLCRHAREKSLGSLKTHLPQLFRAMSEFSFKCSETYGRLRDISHEHGHGSPD